MSQVEISATSSVKVVPAAGANLVACSRLSDSGKTRK